MSARRVSLLTLVASLAVCPTSRLFGAQTPSLGRLPATAPTQSAAPGPTAPIAAVATPADRPGEAAHPAQVHCVNGELEVQADNSSLNSILRAIARCTGMRITGGVAEQRVYGNYGPAAPATVLATLIDGTGSNMLLRETASDQPAELILTPRTGGPTPPSPSTYAEDTVAPRYPGPRSSVPTGQPPNRFNRQQYREAGPRPPLQPGQPITLQPGAQTPVPQPTPGPAVTGPLPIPQPINNVNGSPNNVSPTASTYPTTNSVPLDAVRTPSTTPSTSGIVDAPNPPPAGSDTAAGMNGAPNGTPGTTNINPEATSPTATPGGTNTSAPANTLPGAAQGQTPNQLTPEQIFQELQQRQQQHQQQTSPQ